MAYVFDPDALHEIVCDSVGLPWPQVIDKLVGDLDAAYPGHVEVGERHFILNNAGGAMGQIVVLHASLREYLILYGSPIGTEGHSGRLRTELWDFVVRGQLWRYQEGELHRTVYKAGDMAHRAPGQAVGYRLPDQAWMLGYARGSIPSMLPFALADSLFSTLDFTTVGRTAAAYARLLLKGALPDPRRKQPGVMPQERYRRGRTIAEA